MKNDVLANHIDERMIDLNDLRIFAYVASLASFSTAADALNIHKSSVSRSIARLEALLATPLLQRTTRKVVLTTRGLELKERCIEMLSRVHDSLGFAKSVGIRPRPLAVESVALSARPKRMESGPSLVSAGPW